MPPPKLIIISAFVKSNSSRFNWSSHVKKLLYEYGFGYIWGEQSVGNDATFLETFKIRITDCHIQLWNANVESMSKLHFYKTFKTSFIVEPYLLLDIPRRLQVCLSRFRTTSHNLEC